jgi:hypothetical protein
MEATTTPETPPQNGTPPEEPQGETSPAEVQSAEDLFRYSEYVHVGPGAADCEDGENGSCGNPLHFHGWCRLPNRFQDASIREKAMAAKARKARQLRDPNADAHEILEGDMDALARIGNRDEAGKEMLIEEILGQSYWKDQIAAIREVNDREEYATIQEDQERYRHLLTLSDAERNADEFGELERHITGYQEAIKEERERLQTPRKEGLLDREVSDLIAEIREMRIDAEANEDFMRVFSLWEWYIGTLKPVAEGSPHERVFASVEQLQGAAPEVIDELEQVFGRLESALGTKSALGNL